MIDLNDEKSYVKLTIIVILFSIFLSVLFSYFYRQRIEYKFISSINENNFSKILSYICEDERIKKVNNNYEIIWFLKEEIKEYNIQNFQIYSINPPNPETEKEYFYKVYYSYDIYDKKFWVRLGKVKEKYFFVKLLNNKKCISFWKK